jgi:hypothetical protein
MAALNAGAAGNLYGETLLVECEAARGANVNTGAVLDTPILVY